MTLKHSIVSGAMVSSLTSTALVDIKIGSIGGLSSDTDLSTLHGAEIAIEGINTADGMSGEKLVFVSADVDEGVTEGIKACRYLIETEEADFTISGFIDDTDLG